MSQVIFTLPPLIASTFRMAILPIYFSPVKRGAHTLKTKSRCAMMGRAQGGKFTMPSVGIRFTRLTVHAAAQEADDARDADNTEYLSPLKMMISRALRAMMR